MAAAEPRAAGPVDARAMLVDPVSLGVVWMNESAARSVPPGEDATLATVVPLAEELGVPEAVRVVADTGEPRHLHTSLVSTHRGGMAVVISIYRLPDGHVLVITDRTWQAAAPARKTSGRTSRRAGR